MKNEMLHLRPYQNECLKAIHAAIHEGTKRPAVVLPTGSGKTVIFSHLCAEWSDLRSNGMTTGRVLILVHREELIAQTVNKLAAVAPHLRVGVVKADRNEHEDRDVIVASIQTVRKLFRLDQITATGAIGLVIVDECHHAAAESYLDVLNALGCFTGGGAFAVGFTATLVRADKKALGSVWQEVVYQCDILDMIRDGYLTDVQGRMITVDGLSLAQVSMRGGDYAVGSLSEALLSADAPKFAADAWEEHAGTEKGVVFTPSVQVALAFAEEFQGRGIPTGVVWGAMPADTRSAVMRDVHAGRVSALINCMILTEGFDWPAARVCMIARPTTSAGLYVQMVGRVLRPFPGKDRALVLDIVGASQEHRLASLADLTSQRIQVINEGESLTDAVAREREARNPALADYAVSYEDVDLFQRSNAAWLQTYKGIWFVNTRDHVYFVWPGSEPGLYKLGKRLLRKRGGEWLHDNVTLELAMSWGSQYATNADLGEPFGVATRNAAWRTRRPSDKMKAYATRLGLGSMIEANPDIRQGELSNLIDVKLASGVLDKAVR